MDGAWPPLGGGCRKASPPWQHPGKDHIQGCEQAGTGTSLLQEGFEHLHSDGRGSLQCSRNKALAPAKVSTQK